MKRPAVSVVIPSLRGGAPALQESIQGQTLNPDEVQVIAGVKPAGRARNEGVKRTKGEILVFIDDDVVLGHNEVLKDLIFYLDIASDIGVVGASYRIPPRSRWFQRWVAREVPRMQLPIVDQPLETNPDAQSGYYCLVSSACCAMRRAVFEEAGGFDEGLITGEDREFFIRIRRLGYRFILAPHTWVWHPAPATLPALLRKHFFYGASHSQEVKRDPLRSRGRFLHTPLHALLYLFFRTLILIPNIFVPYSFAHLHWRLGFKPLKALTSYVSALGYIYGWYRYQ